MRPNHVRALAAWAVFLLCSACVPRPSVGLSEQQVDVALSTAFLPNDGPLVGISNLMFDTLPTGLLKLRPEWRQVEFDVLSKPAGFRPVYVIRFRDADSVERIVVDLDADADLTNDVPLRFHRQGRVDMADAVVQLRGTGELRRDRAVTMQVIVATPYAYGRIAEYRRGSVVVQNRTYALALRSASRMSPLIDLDADVRFFVDANGDRQLRERGVVDGDGNMRPSEAVRIDRPFLIGRAPFDAVGLDASASYLRLRRSSATVSPAVGFQTPSLSGRDVDGRVHRLSALRGKVVLLSFWSTECPYSEQVRPALDSLAARLGDSAFEWVAMARDVDAAPIRAHLISHPMRATVLANDSPSWMEFNPGTITPLFYVIDRAGNVRVVESGATAIGMVVQAVADEVHRTKR